MSDDGREGPAARPTDLQSSEQISKDAAPNKKELGTIRPPPSANIMPGGTENTAGGHTKPVNAIDAAKSIKLEDFQEIHKKPCVRNAFLTGIPSGVFVGVAWVLVRGGL